MERQRRPKKKKQMFGEGSKDSELSYDKELKREMFLSMDKVILEITLRFEQLHELAKKYDFLTPKNLLDDEYECEINTDIDEIDKEEFLVERKRLQHFILVSAKGEKESWNEGPLNCCSSSKSITLGTLFQT